MRVLMFGWEFPPHISGGLGTASFGLTRGMTTMDDMEVIFVVPKAWGDEDQSVVRLIGANKVPVAFKKIHYQGSKQTIRSRLSRRLSLIPIRRISGN
jgi:glycogen(starch) synthase